jgi:hypothetical protein
MRILGAIAPPEEVLLPVALPVPGSSPLRYEERKFVLREHTPAGLCDYFADQQQARMRALVEFASLPPEERTKEVSLRIWSEMHAPFVAQILSEPADGGEPATIEACQLLSHTRRAEVLAAQEQLSGLEEALGNALDLISPLLQAEDQVSP